MIRVLREAVRDAMGSALPAEAVNPRLGPLPTPPRSGERRGGLVSLRRSSSGTGAVAGRASRRAARRMRRAVEALLCRVGGRAEADRSPLPLSSSSAWILSLSATHARVSGVDLGGGLPGSLGSGLAASPPAALPAPPRPAAVVAPAAAAPGRAQGPAHSAPRALTAEIGESLGLAGVMGLLPPPSGPPPAVALIPNREPLAPPPSHHMPGKGPAAGLPGSGLTGHSLGTVPRASPVAKSP